MAIKIEFDAATGGVTPTRLVSYGALPLKNSQMLKIFEGPHCHVKFLLWALQNVTDYKMDARADQTLLNIYTIGGSTKEMPLLLRGMVQLAGRDTHFFGDLNRLKCLWHENIKFYDLLNFFEHSRIDQLAVEWLKTAKIELLLANAPPDKAVRSVLTIYHLSVKFIKEVQTIEFGPNSKKLDLSVH